MTTRATRHCFDTCIQVAGQGLGAGGLRLRLTRELPSGIMASRHDAGGQLLPWSPVDV